MIYFRRKYKNYRSRSRYMIYRSNRSTIYISIWRKTRIKIVFPLHFIKKAESHFRQRVQKCTAGPGQCKSTPDLASQLQRQNDLLVVILLCLCCCMLTANESILLIYLLLMIIFKIIIDNNIVIIIINILWINIEY